MHPQQIHDLLRETLVYLEFEDYRLLAPYDLDTVEYSALRILNSASGLRMGDLRDRLLIDKSKVTRVVDHLEAHGWAERVPDPDDRRAARVVLTPNGQAHWEHVTAARVAELSQQFAGLSNAEQATLGHLLETLRDSLVGHLNNNEEDHS